MDALYILSPRPHIVECLVLDLAKGRYRNSTVLWTGILGRELRARLAAAPQKIGTMTRPGQHQGVLANEHPRRFTTITDRLLPPRIETGVVQRPIQLSHSI